MKVLVLPGDGIGPEIVPPTLEVLRAADGAYGLGLEIETQDIGFAALAGQGTTVPRAVLDRIPQVDGVILGPVSHYEYPPRQEGGINPSAELRVRFELFANIRPCRSRAGLSVLPRPMDLVIVRENTEGFYSDRNMYAGSGEFMPDPDNAFSVRRISARGCERVARAAFELARRRRRKATAVHKANVLKLSDELFLRVVREVAAEFPEVELDELIVDAAAAALIRRPDDFDVIVTTNMFGDILSDEAAELSGSLGLGGSLNAGHDVAVAQAQHGSAPDIAGQGIANPTSLILSAAMLLDWRGRRDGNDALLAAAAGIESAVESVLAEPGARTRDLGGDLGTAEFAGHVAARLRDGRPQRHQEARRRADGPDLSGGDGMSAGARRRPSILRPGELPARDRGAGARTVPLVTAARGATAFLNGITSFEPGAAIAHHTHNVAESVIVIEGEAIVDIDGVRTPLRTFDTTFVPANIPHHFENASDSAPMKIFWTYASVEATRTLVDSGEHSRVDAEQPGGQAGAAGSPGIVHEVARIVVRAGREERFEAAVAAAAPLFQGARGARTLVLERSHENPLEYRLVVGWDSIDDHISGFRGSDGFRRWRDLIGDTIAGLPEVAHFHHVLTAF